MEIKFPFQFLNGSVLTEANLNNLAYQHLYIMLATWEGERVMLLSYGGPFRSVLFDPADAATTAHLIRLIQDASQSWNNDLEITSITPVTPDAYEDRVNTITLDVAYNVVKTGARDNTVVRTDGVLLREVAA